VCRLIKSLYSLKQSPRQWYLRFDTFMIKHGYSRSKIVVFIIGSLIMVLLYIYFCYVDDMLIVAKDMSEVEVESSTKIRV